MASSSDKKSSDAAVENKDVVDAEVIEETDPSADTVDEMADADGVESRSDDDDQSDGADDVEEPVETEEDQTVVEAKEETTALTVAPPAQEPASRSMIPMVIGGLIAAGIGWFAATNMQPEGVSLTDMSDLRTTVTEQAAEIAELGGTLATANTTIEELTGEVGALTEANSAQTTQIEELAARLDERPVVTTEAQLSAELAALIEEQKVELSTLQSNLAEMTAFAEGQIQTAQEEAEAAEDAEARAKARDALNTVRLALASGAPFGDALEAISGATDVPETLSSVADGVPTQSELQDGFGAFARNALAASNRELSGDTAGDRLGLFLQDMIGSRSLTPQEGDSPDAVLSRVEAAVKNGDLSGALSTIEALPENGKAALSEWVGKAQARDGAVSAFNELTDALSAD